LLGKQEEGSYSIGFQNPCTKGAGVHFFINKFFKKEGFLKMCRIRNIEKYIIVMK